MRTNADSKLFDTSAALAFLLEDHVMHAAARAAAGSRPGLAGHAHFETYSVLTRLPPPDRVSPSTAVRLITANFADGVFLNAEIQRSLPSEFTAVGISGGAVYDALVGAAARLARRTLVTADQRARATYLRIGVDTEFLG